MRSSSFALLVMFCLSCATAAAGKDVDIERQFRKGMGDTADGGIAIEEGATVSFDSAGKVASKTAGYWKGLSGKLYTVLFSLEGPKDRNEGVLVEFRGTLRWNKDGKIAEMTKEFAPKRIMTNKGGEKWYEVSSFKEENGKLKVTSANEEAFLLSGFSPRFRGIAESTKYIASEK